MRRLLPHAMAPLLAAGLLTTSAAAQVRLSSACRPVLDPAQQPVQGTTLRMAPATYNVGSRSYTTNVYNGQFVAPTLTMQPGQQFQLSVVNNMTGTASEADTLVTHTNFHTHGLVVTPSPNGGDNVTHISTPNGGGTQAYNFPVPAVHTQGMFWYHPHPHGVTGPQVAGGLSGALMVGSVLTYFPQFQGVRERTLLIRDMSFNFDSASVFNVNGSTCALFPMGSGEQQLWHIGNFGANHFVNLKLRDVRTGTGVQWLLLALDGNYLAAATPMDSLYLPPGSRAEVIVTGPPLNQPVELYSDSVFSKSQDSVGLGYLIGTGSRTVRRAARPAPAGVDAALVDTLDYLMNATDVGQQTFTYSFPDSAHGGGAAVNGKQYAPSDPPVLVPFGQVQEWTIVNGTTDLHTFHIHQTDFLVMSVNGQPANEGRLRDNIPIGVHQTSSGLAGDTVVIRFVFEPIAAGPFVFHCHVLQHEDEGMMMNVCVDDPADPNGQTQCNSLFSSQPAHH
ncbi:multicopper oxidase family protein [Longimicrobium sp.]|uniref:multicopper oxidase family protein n=1 Tax=Longimicrobium sp. TaxID=2029185 RepID=UPI002ED88123